MAELIFDVLPSVVSAGLIGLFGVVVRLLLTMRDQHKKGQQDIRDDLKELKNEIVDLKETQYDLLRDRLLHLLRKALREGYCSSQDRENLERLFKDYKEKLHGNGTIEDMYHRVCKLPYIKDEL